MTPDLAVALIEHAADAVVFADRQGVIRVWNASAEAVFGFPAPEAIGRSLDLIVPERLREAHWKAFDVAIETGRTRLGRRAMITRTLHKSGERRYVDMSFAVVHDASGAVVGSVAIARDATERYAADTAMKRRIAELEKPVEPPGAAGS